MRVCAPVCACVGVGVSVGVGVGVSVGVGVWACGCVGVAKTLHPSRGVKSRCKKKTPNGSSLFPNPSMQIESFTLFSAFVIYLQSGSRAAWQAL